MIRPQGLSEAEAQRRLRQDGPNALPQGRRRGPMRILVEVLQEPMLLLLLAGGGIYLVFGDLAEALILLIFASFSIVVTTVQESRTERILDRLRDLSSPRALVIRDGEARRIAGAEVVRGDVLVVAEGDRVAADGWLFEARELTVDESLLTGESVPVGKAALPSPPDPLPRPGGENSPMVYSGSLVVRGQGLAQVMATGPESQMGRIGQSLAQLDTEPPRLRRQTLRIVRVAGVLGGLGALAVTLLYGLAGGDWLNATLAGIAIGMALLPEEFPVVLTVFMAVGAWRIAGARVLTRRAAAIESLGAATVLCTDKTGTLTKNQMVVAELDGHVAPFDPASPAFRDAALVGLLASPREAMDPMDRAFQDLGRASGIAVGAVYAGLALRQSFGLEPGLLAVTQIWGAPPEAAAAEETALPPAPATGGAMGGAMGAANGVARAAAAAAPAPPVLAVAKGAPEAIAELCRMTPTDRAALMARVDSMAARGLRVLGLAQAELGPGARPAHPRDIAFRFAGLAGLADPLRDSVPAAVAEARAAGIRVVMITGDYPLTARAIAAQAGIGGQRVLTGEAMAGLDAAGLDAEIAQTQIFARILPDQKLRLVQALKAQGQIVAMTGDGVNDAPSLKAAHIGIAMGGRGTDVAREASAIVLLDDDFGAILQAVRLGRRIFDNLRKAMGFILAIHVPIAGLAILPLLLGQPMILMPVHIAFLEMIIDPVCTLVFEAEAEERNVMARPPRDPQAAIFSPAMLAWAALQGLGALGAVLGVYALGWGQGLPQDELRVLTFLTLVLVILTLIFVNRSFNPAPLRAFRPGNRAIVWVPALVAVALALVTLWPWAAALFAFGPLHWHDLAASAGAAAGLFLLLQLLKAGFGARLAA